MGRYLEMMTFTISLISTLSWRECLCVPIPDQDDSNSEFFFLNTEFNRMVVFLERSLNISCATSDPNAKVTLSRTLGSNTEDLTVGSKITEQNSIFTINKITVKDGGIYSCTAENSEGNVIKRDVIQIFPLPYPGLDKPVLNSSSPIELDYGENANIMCQGNARYNPQWVRWFNSSHREPVPGKMIINLPKTRKERSKILQKRTVLRIKSKNEPLDRNFTYACVSSDGIKIKTTYLILRIKEPRTAKISNLNSFVMVMKGDKFRGHCESHGLPRPTIKWFKNGAQLKDCILMGTCNIPGQNYEIRGDVGQKLIIRNAHELNSGTITCQASNGVGKPDTRNMRFIVVNSFPMDEVSNIDDTKSPAEDRVPDQHVNDDDDSR